MQEGTSRLLRVVVAAALLNALPDGRANSLYEEQRVVVTGYRIEEWDEWSPDDYFIDDYTEYVDERSEPSDPGGDDAMTEEERAVCDAIAAETHASCDLQNPPTLIMNGCGSESSELVPDYLIINFSPVLHLGPIFTGACNRHDRCYGTYGADKNACDMVLYTDMVEMPKDALLGRQYAFYAASILLQAHLYSRGLQSPFLAGTTGEAFASAQREGACRYYSVKAKEAGCTQ